MSALGLDGRAVVSQNVAVLELLSRREPELGLSDGPLARTRLLAMLSFLPSELGIAFKPLFHGADDAEKAIACEAVAWRLVFLLDKLRSVFLFGHRFTLVDASFFRDAVMT